MSFMWLASTWGLLLRDYARRPMDQRRPVRQYQPEFELIVAFLCHGIGENRQGGSIIGMPPVQNSRKVWDPALRIEPKNPVVLIRPEYDLLRDDVHYPGSDMAQPLGFPRYACARLSSSSDRFSR